MLRIYFFSLVLCSLCLPAGAQQQSLDHDVYEIWNRLSSRSIANNGEWASYNYSPEKGDETLEVRGLSNDVLHKIPRGNSARFTHDSQHVLYLISPSEDSVKAAKKADLDEDEMPKDTLGILNLTTGEVHHIPRVQSFKLPADMGNVVAYLLEETDADSTGKGATLQVRDLATDSTDSFAHVKAYTLSPNGAHLVYTFEGIDSLDTGLVRIDLLTHAVDSLLSGGGEYKGLTFDETGDQFAFLSSREGHEMKPAEFTLYYWKPGMDSVNVVATATSEGVPEAWWINPDGSISFSESGNRLYFGTSPRPPAEDEEDEEEDDEDKVVLDVWNWRDPLLQPMQLVNAEREKNRSYRAVIHLDTGSIVQLAHKDVPDISVGTNGDADIVIGWSNLPYQQQISWDSPRAYDTYVIDVMSGTRTMMLEATQSRPSLSPNAEYLTWWDRDALSWMAMSTGGGEPINLSKSIDQAVHNEIHDWPYAPNSYGSAGWSIDDNEFLLYDRHDIWAVNPLDPSAPRNITGGKGRELNLRFRYVRLDFEEDAIADELMLSSFNMETKSSGYYRTSLDANSPPEELVMMDQRFGFLYKAEDADQLLFTRESFREFGDLWTSGLDMSDMKRVSNLNPQQSDYTWGTAELVRWTSLDGLPLTGMLFKPDGFDASQQYPMMVYFYEKMSDGLHQYRAPSTARSSISFSFYVSRGYLVFVPDIPYKVGYPGESALNAVVPGVTMLINQGFVDPARVGVQGHSWGGYQIAYMITESDLFAAAEAGAPVVNMTSAYGGIRWASGMSRMFQYERTQSRIGGSLWETPLRYLDNSPLFQADKVKTPVLMLHNDDDGAVPWYQGIEFFVALRRLNSPVWMLNYNGEGHGLSKYANRKDFAIRMQQFFDHYLMDAPAPVWMTEGIPATMKGETLGLEFATDQEQD